MEEIKSVKNPTVRWMRTLRERKGREESGAFLVEGRKMIEEARNAGLRALCLLAVEELREFAAGFDRAALVPDFVLEGACAAFEMPKTIPLEAAPERLVALDGVQDPGNVGTIWRTADAAGFQGILLGAGCADAMSNKVQRAAMGSGFRLPALQAANLAEALGELRRKGWKVFASALDGEDFYRRPEMNYEV